jgi:class 3 adenylate cyclase
VRGATSLHAVPAVTFLFTNIEGSTRLWEAHPEAMRQSLETHDETIRKEVDANHGRVFKHTGDGAVAAFGSAVDALNAAAGTSRLRRQEPSPCK